MRRWRVGDVLYVGHKISIKGRIKKFKSQIGIFTKLNRRLSRTSLFLVVFFFCAVSLYNKPFLQLNRKYTYFSPRFFSDVSIVSSVGCRTVAKGMLLYAKHVYRTPYEFENLVFCTQTEPNEMLIRHNPKLNAKYSWLANRSNISNILHLKITKMSKINDNYHNLARSLGQTFVTYLLLSRYTRHKKCFAPISLLVQRWFQSIKLRIYLLICKILQFFIQNQQ